MGKYKLDIKELQEHWGDQIGFIQKSTAEFDKGDEKEARRIATSLRILFHDTNYSKSIFSKLNPQMHFLSIAHLYTPSNLLSSWELLSMSLSNDGIYYRPILDSQSRVFFLNFQDWWNEIVFDDHIFRFTRRDIVLYIANQDGGAHVDPEMNESFARLSKLNSLGWTDNNGNAPLNNPAYQSIRTIVNELLVSINLSQKKLKERRRHRDREFEMRIVDSKGRRYKWSSTEINCSPETFEIVSKDRAEKRTLYVEEYENGLKIEYVGS